MAVQHRQSEYQRLVHADPKSGDLKGATKMIAMPSNGAVCLMLNPGNKGLLADPGRAQDENLYVRGVLKQFPRRQDRPKDQLQLLTSEASSRSSGQADRGCDRPPASTRPRTVGARDQEHRSS